MSVPQPVEFEERNLYCPECNQQLPEKVKQDAEEITCANCKWSTKDMNKIPYFMVFAPMHVLECEDMLYWLDQEIARQKTSFVSGEASELLLMFRENVIEALKKADAITDAGYLKDQTE